MFLFIIAFILFIIGYTVDFPAQDLKVVLYVLSGVAVVIEVIANGVCYYGQIEDIEKIIECEERKVIKKNKATILTAEFIKYLSGKYLDHEKEVFKGLTPDKVSIFAAGYPEVKASDTLLALVKKINELQTSIYDEDLNVANMKKNMRVRSRNLWILPFLMPKE